mmetsp:Transcript_21748/g.53244  ORF Transcript_21748/g.53244 Transcript_21748/m.53244 type:complete len:138 (+) Transcript_21748:985-1398(+)
MDAVGGRFFKPVYDSLARGGRLITFGSADFTPKKDTIEWPKLVWRYLRRTKIDPLSLPSENKGIIGFNLIWMFDRAEKLQPVLDSFLNMNLSPPHVGSTFEFGRADDAIREFKSGGTMGKVVVLCDGKGDDAMADIP